MDWVQSASQEGSQTRQALPLRHHTPGAPKNIYRPCQIHAVRLRAIDAVIKMMGMHHEITIGSDTHMMVR